jgi:hypothetical protein
MIGDFTLTELLKPVMIADFALTSSVDESMQWSWCNGYLTQKNLRLSVQIINNNTVVSILLQISQDNLILYYFKYVIKKLKIFWQVNGVFHSIKQLLKYILYKNSKNMVQI